MKLITEKSILFSGEMVRAILDGRKTMTRRIVKPQPTYEDETIYAGKIYGPEKYEPVDYDKDGEMIEGMEIFGAYDEDGEWGVKCPYEPGMKLWVRETFFTRRCACCDLGDEYSDCTCGNPPKYRADGYKLFTGEKWSPSLFMPRWASRITLEVTGVRIERLQSITEEDARAEGIKEYSNRTFGLDEPACCMGTNARIAFMRLWDSLNAKRGYGWKVNPWVWVVQFRKMEGK